MRFVRYALLSLGGLLLLLAATAVLVVMLFDPNAHKADLQRLVRAQTGRELTLAGELKLSVFPWVALETGRATLGNAAGFGTAPMIAIEHARLGLKLLPLLHRRVEISAIRIDAPTIRLAVDAAGRNNWADLGRQQASPAPDSAAATMPAVSVAGLQITRGTLLYADGQAGSEVALRELDVSTGALASDKPFELRLSGTLQQNQSLSVGIQVSAAASLNPEASRYQLASPVFALQVKGAGLPAAGLAVDLSFDRIDADLAAQTVTLPGMDLRAAGARLTGALNATNIMDSPQLSGPLRLADVSLRAVLQKLGISLPVTRDPAAFGHFGLEGTVAADSHSLMLNKLSVRFDDTTATGRGGISDLDRKALTFDLKLDHINADRYLAPAPTPAPATGGKGAQKAAPLPVPVELLRALDLHGALTAGEAVFAGIQYSHLRLGINAQGGGLRIFPVEAQMYGGQYRGDVHVDVAARVPQVSFDEHVIGVDFARLCSDMFGTRRISGRGNAAIKASATGADTAALLRTLTGTLEFHLDNGALEGADLWYEIRRARALLKGQPVPERNGPERTPFTAFSATGRIAKGVVFNDDLIAALEYLQVRGRGTADLPGGLLDYHLDVSVINVPEDGSDGMGLKDLVGLKVPVIVSGTFDAPRVRPDLAALAKARVQQEIAAHKDELRQKLKSKLQDKLKELFGH